jgi:transposase
MMNEKFHLGSSSARVRTRAHAILLSSEGFTIEELMEIFHVERDTISRWLNNWEQGGFEGLHDKARNGRVPTLNEDEQNVLKQLIKENPRSSKVVAQELFKKTGKTLSHWSIKRLAKEFGLSWKRKGQSLKSKRDDDKFNEAYSSLETIERVALTSAKNNQKNEEKAEPLKVKSDSDIDVFKRLINTDQIIIDDENIAKVVKPETFEVATKNDSSSENVTRETTINSDNQEEAYQYNKINNLSNIQIESENEILNETLETKIILNIETEEVACAYKPETNNCKSDDFVTEPPEVEMDETTRLNTNKPFNKDIFDVVYFDATGFDLVPSVPYAWQPTGRRNTICVPSTQSQRINVLGFLNKINNELTPFVIEGTVNTDVVVAIFEDFSKQTNSQSNSSCDGQCFYTYQSSFFRAY